MKLSLLIGIVILLFFSGCIGFYRIGKSADKIARIKGEVTSKVGNKTYEITCEGNKYTFRFTKDVPVGSTVYLSVEPGVGIMVDDLFCGAIDGPWHKETQQ